MIFFEPVRRMSISFIWTQNIKEIFLFPSSIMVSNNRFWEKPGKTRKFKGKKRDKKYEKKKTRRFWQRKNERKQPINQ